jgi:anti-sigma B factor antagonist
VVVTVTRPRLCEEDNIEQFGVELNQLVDHFGYRWLAIDLHQVTLITSAAVGKLISLHRHLHRRDGQLALCGVTGFTLTVFESARLIDYFHVTTSAEDAVEQLVKAKAKTSPSS